MRCFAEAHPRGDVSNSTSPVMERRRRILSGLGVRFKQPSQVEIPDRLSRELPTPLATQTADAGLLVGIQRSLQAGRSDTFRKLEPVYHRQYLPNRGSAHQNSRRLSQSIPGALAQTASPGGQTPLHQGLSGIWSRFAASGGNMGPVRSSPNTDIVQDVVPGHRGGVAFRPIPGARQDPSDRHSSSPRRTPSTYPLSGG